MDKHKTGGYLKSLSKGETHMNKLIIIPLHEDKLYTAEGIEEKYRKDMALLIPRSDTEPYIKYATQALVNSTWELVTATKIGTSHVSYEESEQGKTDEGIHRSLITLMKEISNLQQHIVHSASWRDGEYHAFDMHTFQDKIDRIKLYAGMQR